MTQARDQRRDRGDCVAVHSPMAPRWVAAAGTFLLAFVPAPSFLVVQGYSLPSLLLACVVLIALWRGWAQPLPRSSRLILPAFVCLMAVSSLRCDDRDAGLIFLAGFLLAVVAGLALAPFRLDCVLAAGALARIGVEVAAHIVEGGAALSIDAKLGDAGSYHLVLAGILLPIAILAAARRNVIGSVTGALFLALTRSRAALLAFAFGLLALAVTRLRQTSGEWKEMRWRTLAVAGAGVGGLAAVLAWLSWGDAVRSMIPRFDYARAAIEAVWRHPWLGLGWGGFATEVRDLMISPAALDPHNLPLHIAVEAGIPALLLFGGLLWSSRRWDTRFVTIVAMLVYSMFASFYLDWPIFWVLLFAGSRDDG